MSSRSRQSSDPDESTDRSVSDVLAEEKERTVTIEQTTKWKNAHILVNGDPVCYHNIGSTTPIDGELPSQGLCAACVRRLKLTEVVTVEEVIALLPESAEIEGISTDTIRTDGGAADAFICHPYTRTLHHGTREHGATCGTPGDEWVKVDAPNPLAAIINHGVQPCTRCFHHTSRLNRVYLKLHTATVVRNDLTEITATLPWSLDDAHTDPEGEEAHA